VRYSLPNIEGDKRLLRRNRTGLKRIGLLALALVIALGSLGVAYAAWTDTVYVSTAVQTGTLDINIYAVSSTFVYKVPGALEKVQPNPDEGVEVYLDTVVHYVDGSVDPSPYTPDTDPPGQLVAKAVTTFDNGNDDPDTATMTLTGLFPCIDFQTDLYLEYGGTVPAIVSVATITPDDPTDEVLTALWNLGKATKDTANPEGIWLDGLLNRNDGQGWVEILEPEGLQLHRFDQAHITLHVHLPQNPDYENLSNLQFTGLITVVQWNEYDDGGS
jgi:hypothetical protein